MSDEQLLTSEDVEKMTGLTAATLEQWRARGQGPKFLKLGRNIRYRRSDIKSYLEEHTFQSTAEAKEHRARLAAAAGSCGQGG